MSVHTKVKRCRTCGANTLHALGAINKVCAGCLTARPIGLEGPQSYTPPSAAESLIRRFEEETGERITGMNWRERGLAAATQQEDLK